MVFAILLPLFLNDERYSWRVLQTGFIDVVLSGRLMVKMVKVHVWQIVIRRCFVQSSSEFSLIFQVLFLFQTVSRHDFHLWDWYVLCCGPVMLHLNLLWDWFIPSINMFLDLFSRCKWRSYQWRQLIGSDSKEYCIKFTFTVIAQHYNLRYRTYELKGVWNRAEMI